MSHYEITGNVFRSAVFAVDRHGTLQLFVANQRRHVVDCRPDGKWRFGDTIGKVPKGHDCIIEGFMLRGGRTVQRGRVTYVPNDGGEPNYILRGNDVA
jgi:hypothetical protein